MWKKEVSIKTLASAHQIWKIWTAVNLWNQWDEEVKSATLNGEFVQGSQGFLTPTKGPKSKFVLSVVNFKKEFTTSTSLPLAKMHFTHKISESNGERIVTHGVEISGITSFIFSKLIGEKIIAALPKALENLSVIAKKM